MFVDPFWVNFCIWYEKIVYIHLPAYRYTISMYHLFKRLFFSYWITWVLYQNWWRYTHVSSLIQVAQVVNFDLSCAQVFATPWTIAHQAPLSMGFFRQEHWSGLPFPSQTYLTHNLFRSLLSIQFSNNLEFHRYYLLTDF